MANNNNSKKNKKTPQYYEAEAYDPSMIKGSRKNKRRSRRHNDKNILKQFPDHADEYFSRHEDMG